MKGKFKLALIFSASQNKTVEALHFLDGTRTPRRLSNAAEGDSNATTTKPRSAVSFSVQDDGVSC